MDCFLKLMLNRIENRNNRKDLEVEIHKNASTQMRVLLF